MRSLPRNELRNIALYFLAWTIVGIYFFSQALVQRSFSHDPTPWWHYLASWMIGVYLCAAFTPVIRWASLRFPIERRVWVRRVALHLLFSLVFSVVQLLVQAALIRWFGLFPNVMTSFAATFLTLVSLAFHQNLTTYWTILGLVYAFRMYGRYREREKQALLLELNASELRSQLVRAQLSALKMQLQPHFLFNTLNAIMVLVRQQKTRDAEETLVRLSDLLRCVLDDVEAQEVPLRRELEYVNLYLSIEQVRFRDRLRVELAIAPAVLDAAVPHMGLQPIIENAIRHGIGRSSAAGRLEISAARANDQLEIRVWDDGPGLAVPSAGTRGIGLTNTRARLHQLYGDSARLTVEDDPRGGTIATVVLPFREIAADGVPELVESHAVDNTPR